MNEDDSPARRGVKHTWRRGAASPQKYAALRAKETLKYIKAHPGSTRDEMIAAGVDTHFALLEKHHLAYWWKEHPDAKAQWWLDKEGPRFI